MFERITKSKKAVHRSARAAFMNLAYKKVFAKHGAWNTDPAGMETLTNEQYLTSLATAGEDTTGTDAALRLDLGGEYEIYNIKIHSGDGGLKSAASNTGVVTLQTFDGTTWTDHKSQTTVSATYIPIDLDYEGDGIKVTQLQLRMTPDGVRTLYIKPSEIEVFGS